MKNEITDTKPDSYIFCCFATDRGSDSVDFRAKRIEDACALLEGWADRLLARFCKEHNGTPDNAITELSISLSNEAGPILIWYGDELKLAKAYDMRNWEKP